MSNFEFVIQIISILCSPISKVVTSRNIYIICDALFFKFELNVQKSGKLERNDTRLQYARLIISKMYAITFHLNKLILYLALQSSIQSL